MKRRWLLIAAGALVLVITGIALAGIIVWKQRHPGSVRGSAATEFETTEAPGATTRPEEEVRTVPWPTYGYDNARTRYAPDFDLRPPYRVRWRVNGGSLLEFPPVIGYGRLYLATNLGRFLAVDAETGKVAWQKFFRMCTAAAPTIGDGVVYQTFMDPTPCVGHEEDAPGYLVAMDADTGKELWRFKSGVTESSALYVDGIVYFGSWDHKMYAIDAKTHRVKWTFSAGDKIKDGPAYSNGTIYFGSYDHHAYAVDAATGKKRWSASGNGTFYATPAVAYGRVYIGNTDGRVYAFGAKTGHLLWARATGGYVYSSAAVWNQTVYAGSHSGRLFALDAGTGDVRWSFAAGGAISGAPTVIDGIVYFSTIDRRTFALDARSGKKVWEFKDGAYTAVVADEERLYLVGRSRLYGLAPRP